MLVTAVAGHVCCHVMDMIYFHDDLICLQGSPIPPEGVKVPGGLELETSASQISPPQALKESWWPTGVS
ncbi:hypothetical protein Tco_1022600, partial [Tanacetum coccineum]